MIENKFRFIFKNGSFFATRYATLDELLDDSFPLEKMEENINGDQLGIQDLEDYPEYEVFKSRYTGIESKDNEPIYEGDVVHLAGYGSYEAEFPFIELYEAVAEGDVGAILGNIYETPELLEAG